MFSPDATALTGATAGCKQWSLRLHGLHLLNLCFAMLPVQPSNARLVEWASELLSGLLFSFGLVYSGMVRPTKVKGLAGCIRTSMHNGFDKAVVRWQCSLALLRDAAGLLLVI